MYKISKWSDRGDCSLENIEFAYYAWFQYMIFLVVAEKNGKMYLMSLNMVFMFQRHHLQHMQIHLQEKWRELTHTRASWVFFLDRIFWRIVSTRFCWRCTERPDATMSLLLVSSPEISWPFSSGGISGKKSIPASCCAHLYGRELLFSSNLRLSPTANLAACITLRKVNFIRENDIKWITRNCMNKASIEMENYSRNSQIVKGPTMHKN